MTHIWSGAISRGRLVLTNRDGFKKFMDGFEGQHIELVLRKPTRKRSLEANAYYWGCVLALMVEHTGYDVTEMHEVFKFRFLHRDGELTTPSTSSLDSKEFWEYVEKCRQFAAEQGVVIPDPGSIET